MKDATLLLQVSEASLQQVVSLLSQEEVVGIPTETVYGLAGNALSEKALSRIFEAKGRPTTDPLIVHLSDAVLSSQSVSSSWKLEALGKWVDLTVIEQWPLRRQRQVERLIERFWPGPLTLIFPKTELIPSLATSGQKTVALRIPAHKETQKLLRLLPFPLAAPSANRFGRISPTTAEAVQKELGGLIPAILDGGPCTQGLESTILLLDPPAQEEKPFFNLLRPGALSREALENEIQEAISVPIQATQSSLSPQLAPGMLSSHYAPRKPLYLLSRPLCFKSEATLEADLKRLENTLTSIEANKKAGLLLFSSKETLPIRKAMLDKRLQKQTFPLYSFLPLQTPPALNSSLDPLAEAGALFFQALRGLDETPSLSCLMSEPSPFLTGLGLALQDRLTRAKCFKIELGESS